ncbi:MAG: cytochrome b N-terminal domain-containing protein [Bacteroidales bacterium]|jgi:quinol-cytochrome oxidoreductase complex cytochrome b subunit|nr:cytochrome b N-terminal domain-containing protein [Bacteroidales bacterium]
MTEHSATPKKEKSRFGLILHLHPRKVRASTLRFSLTFGLGGMAALLMVMQVVTGLLLKFHYEPSPENAYNSILNLQESLLFGKMLRNIHHWSAIAFVWIAFLHMLRTAFTGAYRPPRDVTWITGMALLLLVVLSNFTGYLLPWDQLSYWAVTVATSLLSYIPLAGEPIRKVLLGGAEVGQPTLTNFFNLHTGVIPLSIIALMAWHFWRIRRAGGVIVAEKDRESPMVDTRPHLVNREFVVALVLFAAILLISSLFDAPLRERANPAFSPNPAKAPWYFMGLQELLIHFHPVFAVFVLPASVLAAAVWMPYVKSSDANYGIWFLSDNGISSAKTAAAAGALFTVIFIMSSELLPDPEALLPAVPPLLTTGLIPFIIVTSTMWLFIKYMRRRFSLNRSELIQSVLVLMVVSYAVLTVTGIFFRGEGMNLAWPWNI